jgi:transcriptional regulator with XRE-family HTH domain
MAFTPVDRKVELLRAGITQASIAEKLGTTKASVSKVLSGKRRSAPIEAAIAEALGLDPRVVFPPSTRRPA